MGQRKVKGRRESDQMREEREMERGERSSH